MVTNTNFSGDPSTPVLWYLRDELNLTGPKFGCGMAQCGACTVHIDGMAQRSCVLPVSAVQGRKITTIEGLSEYGDHPVQKAWVEHKVPQCGFVNVGKSCKLPVYYQPTQRQVTKKLFRICRATSVVAERTLAFTRPLSLRRNQ